MSTVIKNGEQGTPLRRLVSFDLADHLAEAHQVVAASRRQAQQMAAEAKAQSVRIKEQARRQGHQQGQAQGHAEGLEQGAAQGLAEATERFNREQAALASTMAAVIDAVERDKRDLLIAANRDLLEFAVALASKVTHRAGEVGRESAVVNTEQALKLVGKKTDLTVRINPLDGDTLRRFAAELDEKLHQQQHLTVVEDDSLAPGGAVVTAGGMEVDTRIETQLEQITTLLLGTAPQRSEKREVRSEK